MFHIILQEKLNCHIMMHLFIHSLQYSQIGKTKIDIINEFNLKQNKSINQSKQNN